MNANTQSTSGSGGKRVRRTLGYLIYMVVVGILALWFLFPGKSLQESIESTLMKTVPGLAWKVGQVHLQLPLALVVNDLTGDKGHNETRTAVKLQQLTFWPDWEASIRRKQFCCRYRFNLQSGRVQGQLCRQRTNGELQVRGSLKDIPLQEMPLLTNWLGRSLHGKVQASYEGKGGTFTDCTWKMACTVEGGELGVVRSILGYQSLPFSQVRMLLTGSGNHVRISEGKIVSTLGNGWFNGSVLLVRPSLQSQVQLRGGLSPQPNFFLKIKATPVLRELQETLKEEPLTFNLSGTVQSPAIHFENLAMQIYALDKERE
nr:type II secretion system protein GspN [uncultured Desulfobulbus sp.]